MGRMTGTSVYKRDKPERGIKFEPYLDPYDGMDDPKKCKHVSPSHFWREHGKMVCDRCGAELTKNFLSHQDNYAKI